jgi:hypothetical protein
VTPTRALHATGDAGAATEALRSARDRLLERAAQVHRPEWRVSFLESVPEHAETIALAQSWLRGAS